MDDRKFQRGTAGWDGKPEPGEFSWLGTKKQWQGWWHNGPLWNKLELAFVLGIIAAMSIVYYMKWG